MWQQHSFRVQVALIVLLFLGSLSALVYSAFTTLLLPQKEQQIRDQLHKASEHMVQAAVPLADTLTNQDLAPDELNQRLQAISQRVLADYPGVEGGFYLTKSNRFRGYAFPTESAKHRDPTRTDPPPLETASIRAQAQQCLEPSAGVYVVSVQDIGPSRVVIHTESVGSGPAAPLVVWLLYRLTGPEQLETSLARYLVSNTLALGGIGLALVLAWNLGRSLKLQRQEQEHLRDGLRRAEHLAGLGKLLAGVAHEVRNPLAGIRSTVQLWQRLPETRTPDSLEAVIAAVDRLNALVTRLLFFSRADQDKRQPVDLNHTVTEVLDLFGAQAANQGVTLERDLALDLPMVLGSPTALQQVLLNLVTNALQAMPTGGCLRCSTRLQTPDKMIAVRIRDTGPGIDKTARLRLFEPFFTTRPEGTGLGLALCREIVFAHGGRIELEESTSAGSTFLVLLPVATASPP